MTTTTIHLLQARSTIRLIKEVVQRCKFTEHSFVNATLGSTQYMYRSGILMYLRTVATNLDFSSSDPIRSMHPEFWKTASQLCSMSNIILYNYGTELEVDFNKIWNMITGPLEKEVYPTIEVLIKAEREKKNREPIITTTPLPSSLPAHSPCLPISAVPTTQLTLDRLRALCHPIFEELRLNNTLIAWAGIFGSVQRGIQRPDSDVDFLVGYAAGADYIRDDSYEELEKKLPKVLGREVDIVRLTQDDRHFGYIGMEALLTAETIWGDPSWLHLSREIAGHLLREGYDAMKKAIPVAWHLEKRLPSSQAEFESPENKALRLSVLEDALFIITTVKIPENPIYDVLGAMIPQLLACEDAIRATVEGELENSEAIWNVVSDWVNVVALEAVVEAAEQTFRRAGLEP